MSTNEIFCIFDTPNVNKYMLKNCCFIVNLHNKNRINSVYLYTFTSVIINSTNVSYQLICKFIDSKRFPKIRKPFFYGKNFPLLTYKN